MTLTEIKEKFICALPAGHGHYKVSFLVRGKVKSGITTNTEAVDKVRNPENPSRYTLKGAFVELYKELM